MQLFRMLLPRELNESNLQPNNVASCSTQVSMKFQLLIKFSKMLNNKDFLAFKFSDVVFIRLLTVENAKQVGI